MMSRPPADLLRPGTLIDGRRPDQVPAFASPVRERPAAGDGRSHRYLPGRADYPAALLTRRSLSLEAGRILSARLNAPRGCRCLGRTRPH